VSQREDRADWHWHVPLVQTYAALIEDRMHFAQANYGDGEWSCLLGHRGVNSQGEVYNPELRDALRETLMDPVGQWCGSNPGPKLEAEADGWCESNGVRVRWVAKETLAAANVNGNLAPFLRACRTRPVVLVGPKHLRALPMEVLEPRLFIEVPESTAWQVAGEIADSLRWASSGHLILLSAGMATNLIVHRVWPELRGRATMLDTGAIFDPYVGVYSRKSYRREAFQNEAMQRNLARGADCERL
jgi:hypothetical protein